MHRDTPPARPRRRHDQPALWRPGGGIQFGLPVADGLGPSPIVVEDADRAAVAALDRWDGTTPSGQEPAWAELLPRSAVLAGAIDDAADVLECSRWRQPGDRIRLCEQADAARLAGLPQTTVDSRARPRVRVEGRVSLADPVRATLDRAGITIVDGDADLVVLVQATHPDVILDPEDARQAPHLAVLAFGPWASAGPLVSPGRTSCRRCRHLHRGDADPAWGILSLQWAAAVSGLASPPVDALLLDLAAVHAALLLRAWAEHPDDPGLWGDRVALTALGEPGARWAKRPPHPLCGCRWSGDAASG
jgi:hypothetical protein